MRQYLDIPFTVIIAFTVTICMLWPLETPPAAPEGSDKMIHLIVFAALAFPLSRNDRFGLLPIFVITSVFAGVIELIQPSFNRSTEMNDWIADILGITLGITCGLIYRQLRPH